MKAQKPRMQEKKNGKTQLFTILIPCLLGLRRALERPRGSLTLLQAFSCLQSVTNMKQWGRQSCVRVHQQSVAANSKLGTPLVWVELTLPL